jgi:predicted nucleic acid-binding Zn ribbon protein
MSMEPVAGALSRLFGRLGLGRGLEGWRAVEEWPRLVGPRVARHARAVSFRDGVLQVEVEGSAWMQELTILRRELVRTINQHLGSECVREVRLMASRGGIPK